MNAVAKRVEVRKKKNLKYSPLIRLLPIVLAVLGGGGCSRRVAAARWIPWPAVGTLPLQCQGYGLGAGAGPRGPEPELPPRVAPGTGSESRPWWAGHWRVPQRPRGPRQLALSEGHGRKGQRPAGLRSSLASSMGPCSSLSRTQRNGKPNRIHQLEVESSACRSGKPHSASS